MSDRDDWLQREWDRPIFFDRAGEPIEWEQWCALLSDNQVVQDVVIVNDMPIWVSTVYVGLDMRVRFGGPPFIYETMTFGASVNSTDICERYATEAEALAGHVQVVADLLERARLGE
jgi:hypothetical protein